MLPHSASIHRNVFVLTRLGRIHAHKIAVGTDKCFRRAAHRRGTAATRVFNIIQPIHVITYFFDRGRQARLIKLCQIIAITGIALPARGAKVYSARDAAICFLFRAFAPFSRCPLAGRRITRHGAGLHSALVTFLHTSRFFTQALAGAFSFPRAGLPFPGARIALDRARLRTAAVGAALGRTGFRIPAGAFTGARLGTKAFPTYSRISLCCTL